MPLPAKGAVAPMPSSTAGLFASRGAGRAAGAACVRKMSFWRSMRSRSAGSRARRGRSGPSRERPGPGCVGLIPPRRKAAPTNSAAPRPRRRRRAPRFHVPGPQRRSAAPGAGLLVSRLPRRRGREPAGTLGSAFRWPISCVASPVEAAGWWPRIVWIGGAADGAQEPRSTASTSKGHTQRLRRLRLKILDQALRTDRRDEGRSRTRQCEDELHRFRAVPTFVAEHPKASCGVALSRRFRCVRLLQWSVEP